MIYRLLLCATIIAVPISASAGDPVLRVPYANTSVRLDGKIGKAEWNDAAVLRNIHVRGNSRLAYPATTIYVKYDKDNLWVAAECVEGQDGYPKAHRRKPTDLLTNDDSLQVVLGISDEASQPKADINFGGYAGATGQKACAADYYYQFTANSAGAVSRFFIESPLDHPKFDAKTSSAKGSWTVEMRIPFSSWGAANPVGNTYPANFFRFRPPDMTAWHLPAFGGYAPMPFGEIHFLPSEYSDQKTVEPPHAQLPTVGNSVVFVNGLAVQKEVAGELSATLEYYPLSRQIIGLIETPEGAGADHAIISVDGVEVARQALTGGGKTKLTAVVSDGTALPTTASLDVISSDGDKLIAKNIDIPDHDIPDWYGTDAGNDYIDKKAPSPWSAPVVEGSRVRLFHNSMEFASGALPGSVVDGLGELLAGEAVVDVEVNGKPISLNRSAPELRVDGVVAQVISDQGALQSRASIEFDGFTTVKMRLRGVDPASVSKVSVAFPIRKEIAKFLNTGHLQNTQKLMGFGWEGPGSDIWLGNQDKGLWFSSDTPLFFSANRRSQIQITEDRAQTWLRFNFVDAPGQITDKDHIFRFFIQPTPTKKPSLAKSGLFGGKLAMWFEEWSDYEGYPDLAKMPEVAKRSAAAHERDQQFILYFNQQLAENSPGFKEFRSELIVPPGLMWYKRAYEPGKGVPCYVCCTHGPFGDLLLDGMRKLRDEGGIDGIYSDGTSYPWECDNLAHRGCDDNVVVRWDGKDESRITGVREFLKRVRGIFDENGRKPAMVTHCGGGLDIPTTSLFDSYYEGEALVRYRPDYAIPLHVFAVGYSGWQWGIRTDMIPALWSSQTVRLLPWSLLHDTQVGGSSGELERKIYSDYSDDATVEYYPYWRAQPHVRKLKGDVLFSYYRKAGSTMLIVSNLTWNEQECELDLNGLYSRKTLAATDMARDIVFPLQGNRARFALDAHSFIALRLDTSSGADAAGDTQPTRSAERTGLEGKYSGTRLADWEVNSADPGVSVQDGCSIGGIEGGIRLGSTVHQSASSAAFRMSIADQGTVRLKIVRSGRLGLNIAGAGLSFDGGWIPSAAPTNTGYFHHPGTNPEKAEILAVSWRDGMIDATYGDMNVAKGLSLRGMGSARSLSLSTWAGDWFAFEVLEISDQPSILFPSKVAHPIL